MSKATYFKSLQDNAKFNRSFDAIITMQQLKFQITKYWSWGVSKVINYVVNPSNVLILSVNANRLKGFVVITLAANDTYSIDFLNSRYGKAFDSLTDVYFDELTNVIDELIEKKSNYIY